MRTRSSQFNNLTFDPPMVMFSANQKPEDGLSKDTVINAERDGEFCWSLGRSSCLRELALRMLSWAASPAHLFYAAATWDLREAVNITAEQVPYGEDEFKLAGLTKQFGRLVKAAMVQESPVKVCALLRYALGTSLARHRYYQRCSRRLTRLTCLSAVRMQVSLDDSPSGQWSNGLGGCELCS